ncbi:RagB/SusD family nutrient uptake outer membrane protein [Parabacteroides sp. APC149_11_2_Y6]
MKYIKSIYTAGLIIAAATFTSCTDLTEKPYSILTSDNYFTDKASVEATVLRPYEHAQWCGWDGDRWQLQELTGDHFVWTQKGRHGYDDGQWVRLHEHKWNYDMNQINGGWVGPYQGIQQINSLFRDFQNLDFEAIGITDTEKANYIGELRALRAWFYIFLIDFYRNVPIFTEENDPDGLIPQSTPEEVFAFIEKELTEILPTLKKEHIIGRFTQAPTAALLARIYFNSNVWIHVDRTDDCKKMCEDIIAGKYGQYSINQQDYKDPFRSGIKGYESPENLFEFPHKRNVYQFGGFHDSFLHYTSGQALGNPDGGNNGIHLQPSRDFDNKIYDFPSKLGTPYEKYADCDYRKQPFKITTANGGYEGFFMIGKQFKFDYSKGYGYTNEPVNGTEEYKGEPLVYVDQVGRFSEGIDVAKEKGSRVTTGEENSGVRFNKFPYLQEGDGLYMCQSAPEIRLAEIYYMLAEIYYRAGNKGKAAELLDHVRVRNYPADQWNKYSYVQNPTLLTDQEFIDEWGREFIGERRRRMDLIRWGRFGDAWWDKGVDPNDKEYTIFPIPKRQLDANPLLKQTTKGW